MGLADDLVAKFAKAVNAKNDTKNTSGTKLQGTIHFKDDKPYVKLDGSDILTPVQLTANVIENERVTVTIKDHMAIVDGNLSSPAARTDDLKDLKTQVESIKGRRRSAYFQDEEPTDGEYENDDVWFDTDAGNKMHHYKDGEWVEAQFDSEAIAPKAITTEKIDVGAVKAAQIDVGDLFAENIGMTGSIVSVDEAISIIFGSGYKYTYNYTNGQWSGEHNGRSGTKSVLLKAGYLSLNELINFSGDGFSYEDTPVLNFNTDGIYSPDMNTERLKAKLSVSTTDLYAGEARIGGAGITSTGRVLVQGNNLRVIKTLPSTTANIECDGALSAGAGANISNPDFPTLNLTRPGVPYYAGFQFNNSLGVLGALGMAKVNGSLTRFRSDLATGYDLLDTENYSSKIPAATRSAVGLMSAADKKKLDGIATGANKITVDGAMSSSSTNPVQNKVVKSQLPTSNQNATNGYIRFPSAKIQVAWIKKSVSTTITTPWGGLYENASPISIGNWAAAFSSVPAISYNVYISSGDAADTGVNSFSPPTTTSAGSVYLNRGTALSISRTYTVTAIGIGTYA